MKKINKRGKIALLIFSLVFSFAKAYTQPPIIVTADPAVGSFTLRNLDATPADRFNLANGTVYYLDIVFQNQHALNAVPPGSAYLLMGLGLNLILDPTFLPVLQSAGYSQYMTWYYQAPSGGQQGLLSGVIHTALPALFSGTATFRVQAQTPGASTISANFNVNNGNPAYRLSDANTSNNTASLSYTVIASTQLSITSVTAANVNCNGGNNGAITVGVTGGTQPYDFSKDNGVTWVTAQTSPYTFTGLTAGNYDIKVKDGANTVVTYAGNAVVITQPDLLVATASGTNASCTNTGTATVNVSGGTQAYTYLWSPGGATTQSISGLGGGTYTVTVTDAKGCVATSAFTVLQPGTPTAPVLGTITQPTCALATGSVALSGLPSTGTWTLTRSPGGATTTGTGTTTTVAGLAAGTHTFTVTNTDGCTSAASANVVINAAPATPATPTVGTITQPTCATATGSVALSGLPSGTWTINPGNISGSGSTTTISGLNPGTYNFTVTNASGCTSVATGNVVINTQPSTPAQPVLSSVTQPTCTTATGSFTITNYNAGYIYTVTPSAGVSQSGATITAPVGTYTVTATLGTCISIASQSIILNINNTINSSVAGGGGTISPLGNTTVACGAAQTYNIIPDPGSVITDVLVDNVSVGAVSIYTFNNVIVNHTIVVSFTSTTYVADPALLDVHLTDLSNAPINANLIPINTVNRVKLRIQNLGFTIVPSGTVTVEVKLGSKLNINPGFDFNSAGLTDKFTWSLFVSTPGAQVIRGVQKAGTAADLGILYNETASFDVYSNPYGSSRLDADISVTNHNNPGQVLVDANPLNNHVEITSYTVLTAPYSITSVTSTNVSCNGANNGSITVQVTGGAYPYYFSKDNGITYTAPAQNSPYIFTGLIPGNYNIKVKDGANTVLTYSGNAVVITQPDLLAANASGTNASCTNTGTATVNVSGGTAAYSYLWSPGGATTQSINGLAGGTYTITVTDAKGCVATSAFTVLQPATPAQPTLSSVTQPTCTTATGSFTITNYNAAYTYAVTPSSGVTRSGATITAPAATYTVTATLGACTSAASASVTVSAQPATPAQPTLSSVTQPTCTTATGSFTITNFNAAYTYAVTPSSGVTRSGATITAPAGTYTVAATLGACTSTASTSVTVNVQPATPVQPTLSGVTQPTCTTATGSFTITNYNAAYTYAVTPSSGVTVSGATITAPAGTYTVAATLGACISIASASVTVNAQPATPAQPTLSGVTQPNCTIATGSFTITNYNSIYTYMVTPSSGVTQSGATITATAGTYTVTATLGSCTSVSSAGVIVNAQPATPVQPTLSSVTQPTCTTATGSFTITNYNGGYSYTVTPSFGVTQSGGMITAPAGTYTVTATVMYTAGPCTSIPSSAVTVNAQPATPAQPTLSSVTQPTCTTATGSFTITNYNAAYIYTVTPSSGVTQSGGTITAPAATYTVSTTLGACTSTASASVTVSAQPATPVQPTLSGVTQPTCTTATGSFTITNYNAAYTYAVTPSSGVTQSGGTITAPAGSYTVVAKLVSCSSISSTAVVVNSQPSIPSAPLVGTITQPTCTTPDGSVVLNGLPAIGTWTINPGNLTGSGTSKTITGLAVGSYNFTVTTTSGCTSPASANIVLVVPASPIATIVAGNLNLFCNGLTLTANSTSNATLLSFEWYAPGATTAFATTPSVILDNNDPDGIYSVYITGNSCRSSTAGTFTYSKQDWLGNYSVLAINKLKFEESQNVLNGSVGLMSTTNTATFDKYDSIPYPYGTSPGSFVKAKYMSFSSPLYIPNRYSSQPIVTLPPVLINSTTPTGTNITITTNNWVQPANIRYKDVTINAGITVTLTDTLYEDITVNAGATVIFTKPVLNLRSLIVKAGYAPAGAPYSNYSKVKFNNSSTVVKVSYKVNIYSYVVVNPDGNSVTFYLADGSTDSEDFTVNDGWNTVINANIYIPYGVLFIQKSNNTPRCYMNGMFIADEIHADYFITWNGNNCNSTSANYAAPPAQNILSQPITQNVFNVKLFPNPTPGDFNIQVITNSNEQIKVRIIDVNGKVVKTSTNMTKGSIMTLTSDLINGIYFVEVTQGKNKTTAKLVKLK